MQQGVHNICVSFSDYILTLDMVMLQDVHYIYFKTMITLDKVMLQGMHKVLTNLKLQQF